MTNIELSFIKKSFESISAAQTASQVAGAIVFDKAHGVLCVDGDIYGGKVQDVTFQNNVLTITKSGEANPIMLNFNDIASASSVMAVFEQIKNAMGVTNAVQNVQDHYNTTAYLQGAQSLIAADKVLDEKIKTTQSAVEGLQDVAFTGKAEDVKVGTITYDGKVLQGTDGTQANDVQTALEGMLQGVIDNEKVTEEAFNAVQNAVGLDEHLNYVQHTNSRYIQGAQSVDQALSQLDEAVKNATSAGVVTVEKDTEPTTGYFATYTVKQNGQQVGVKIDIPKDFLVKSASVQTVTVANQPYEGAQVGDKYIDFVINVKEGTATAEHLYLPCNDIIKPYSTQQNASHIQLHIDTNNEISAEFTQGAVETWAIHDDAVQTAKIYDRAVIGQKIALQGVANENIGVQSVQNWNLAPEVVQVGTQEVIVNSDGTQGPAVSTIATIGGKEIKVAARMYWNEWAN